MPDPGPVSRVKIHPQGPEFSRVIWGSMRSQDQFSSAAELAAFLDFLLERGITTLDTANVYGAPYTVERFLGEALKAQGGRDRFEIVTKVGICRPGPVIPEFRTRFFDLSPEHIRWSVDRSLSEMGIDVIDVLILHRSDHLMDPDATAEALDGVVKQGKVRHIGVSNFLPSRFDLLQSRLKAPIVTNQVQFSPLYLRPVSDGTFDLALKLGHKPMIWSPVGGGRLLTSEEAEIVELRGLLTDIAHAHGAAGSGRGGDGLRRAPSGRRHADRRLQQARARRRRHPGGQRGHSPATTGTRSSARRAPGSKCREWIAS